VIEELREGLESEPSPGVEKQRRQLKADIRFAVRDHPLATVHLLGMLHFFGAAQNERDIALQNAAKAYLAAGGYWGDTDDDRAEIVRKLTGFTVPRRTFWQKLLGR
jgi:hypothetical protein